MPAQNIFRIRFLLRRARQLARRASPGERNGTIIILALAVLAILAIAAVSYVSLIGLDRRSSAAIARVKDFEQQHKAVVSHIGALIGADLFGNKIVTSDVPEFVENSNARIWPKMFEEGETWDVPFVDIMTPNVWGTVNDPTALPFILFPVPPQQFGEDPGLFQNRFVASPDDAWLASSEPIWGPNPAIGDVSGTTEWRQITNLRSAYTWRPNPDNPNIFRWERGDGKFVNLGAYFFANNLTIDNRPDMGLDILHFDNSNYGVMFPADGVGDGDGNVNSPTAVYDKQMDEFYLLDGIDPIFTAADETEWADTDGDLRPDSRWTKLDALGDLFGLNWFVAARIVDASALVNINASLESPTWDISFYSATNGLQTTAADIVSGGLTPADIDLYRLLMYDYHAQLPVTNAIFGDPNSPSTIDLSNLQGVGTGGYSYFRHIEKGLNVPGVIADLQGPAAPMDHDRLGVASPPNTLFGHEMYRNWVPYQSSFEPYDPLTSAQRRAWYEYAGSTPRDPISAVANAYPVRELLDLRSFWGTNNSSMVSKIEQYVDGSEFDGFLPTANPLDGEDYGPLRSRESAKISRTFASDGVATGYPTLERIFRDTRRHLTTVSGVGAFSPVAPINDTPGNKFERVYSNFKVSLPQLKADADADPVAVSENDARRVFESFMWALAPLATKTSQGPGLPSAVLPTSPLREQNFHYGGAAGGAILTGAPGYAEALGDTDSASIDSAYAIMRAGALTVNLIDAMDNTSNTFASLEAPTVLRFYPEVPFVNEPDFSATQVRIGDELRVNARLINGDLAIADDFVVSPPAGLTKYVGSSSGHGMSHGVTFVGLDRQPFLREVHFFAAYQHFDQDNAPFEIDTSDATHQCGSAIAIELGNPWPDMIDVSQYAVRIQADNDKIIEIDLGSFISGSAQIPPGEHVVFVWRSNEGSHDTTNPVNQASMQLWALQTAPWATHTEIGIYDHWKTEVTGTADAVVELAVDSSSLQLLGSLSGTTPFPTVPFALLSGFNLDSIQLVVKAGNSPTGSQLLVDRLSMPSGTLAFPFNPGVIQEAGVTPAPTGTEGRLVRATVNANIVRPNLLTTMAGTSNGFPAYVLERREENVGTMGPVPNTDGDPHLQGFTELRAVPNYLTTSAATDPKFVTLADRDSGRLLGDDNKGTLVVSPNEFQLFVPNRRLDYVADLALLPAFCTMYVHATTGNADINAAGLNPLPSGPTGPGYWITFAEQMGLESEMFLDYNGTANSGTIQNPYWGVINPVSYILGDTVAGMGAPYGNFEFHESLKVPLGTRIFEPFEAIDLKNGSGFAEGRINVNTMTQRVAEVLPVINPTDDIAGNIIEIGNPGMMISNVSVAEASRRPALLTDYRDLPFGSTFFTQGRNGPTTLNLPVRIPAVAGNDRPGFVNTGEMSILAHWDANLAPDFMPPGTPPASGGRQTMLDLVIAPNDTQNAKGLPFNWWSDANPALKLQGAASKAYALTDYDPTSDPEERIAFFRAISNVVSTRSDVFIATFIVRGYDPDRIENISVTPGDIPEQSMSKTGDQAFEPAYEARYLAVFDRSNIRIPTDRPEVLLVVELPIVR